MQLKYCKIIIYKNINKCQNMRKKVSYFKSLCHETNFMLTISISFAINQNK